MALRIVEKASLTDVGRQRQSNEDAFFERAPLFAVADGMGGARAGEVASRMAVEELAAMDLRSGVRPRLEVVAALGYEPGTAFEIHESATLGRSPTADVRIDDPYASSAHARIFPRGQFMYIEDMGSTNGTYVNGRQLRRPERLKDSDTIRIGDTEYRYEE